MLRIVPFFALAMLPLFPAAAAVADTLPGDPTPQAPSAVRASYDVDVLDSLDAFRIAVRLDIQELELPLLGSHTAAELRAAPAPVRVVFERALEEQILAQSRKALPETEIHVASFRIDYGSEDLDEDPYDPPVSAQALLDARFTPRSLGLPARAATSTEDAARAVLQSGGVYRVATRSEVPAGFDVRHTVRVPASLQILIDGEPRPTFEARGDNFAGEGPATLPMAFAIRLHPALLPPNGREGPLLHATLRVDEVTPLHAQVVPTEAPTWRTELDLEVRVASLSAKEFEIRRVPARLELEHFSADVLRIALREDLINPELLEGYFQDALTKAALKGLGQETEVVFDREAFQASLDAPLSGSGEAIEPLVIRGRAQTVSPNPHMFVSTGAGRLMGAVVGASASFEVANDGPWPAHLQVLYPKSSRVDAKDSAGLVRDLDSEGRDGFEAVLPPGASTRIQIDVRDYPPPVVMLSSIAQVLVVGLLVRAGFRHSGMPKGMPPNAI